MNKSAVCLVEKRDGRVQPMRATKLARSMCLALAQSGCGGEERAIELAGLVLQRLGARCRRRVTSHEIEDAVQQVLLHAGLAAAACWHHRVAGGQRHRRRLLASSGAASGPGERS